jgi:hypothetical protein
MDDQRQQAAIALSLVEGLLRADPSASGLLIDTFDSVEQAAAAHAYLAGFTLQCLAVQRAEDLATTAAFVRHTLTSNGAGPGE